MRKFLDMLSHQNQYYSVKTSFKHAVLRLQGRVIAQEVIVHIKMWICKNIYDIKFISVVIYKYKKLGVWY